MTRVRGGWRINLGQSKSRNQTPPTNTSAASPRLNTQSARRSKSAPSSKRNSPSPPRPYKKTSSTSALTTYRRSIWRPSPKLKCRNNSWKWSKATVPGIPLPRYTTECHKKYSYSLRNNSLPQSETTLLIRWEFTRISKSTPKCWRG